MHTTSIQKLSFILFIFTNTRVYATNIRRLKDIQQKNNVNINFPKYDQERADKKATFHQQLLEKNAYFGKEKTYRELIKNTKNIVCAKRQGRKPSQEEQELLNERTKLGVELQDIYQRVKQQAEQKYPYSGQKGWDHDKKESDKNFAAFEKESDKNHAARLEELGKIEEESGKNHAARLEELRELNRNFTALIKKNADKVDKESSESDLFNNNSNHRLQNTGGGFKAKEVIAAKAETVEQRNTAPATGSIVADITDDEYCVVG